MKFSEAIAEEARRLNKSEVSAEFKNLAKPLFNLGYLEVGKSWEWPELKTWGSIVAIPVYKTGTATVTNGSHTVNFAGATITADFKGRFFKVSGGDNIYRIVYVNSSSQITLDKAVNEDSGSYAYEIEKRFYTLPTEVRVIIGWDQHETMVVSQDHHGLRQTIPNFISRILDVPFEVIGSEEFADDYSTGTINVEADGDIVVGTGTSWLDNVEAGNILTYNNADYRVKRVESDTRLITYNKLVKATAVTYSISKDQAKTVRLRAEFSENRVIPFTYIRTIYPLVHDDDRIELSEEAKLACLDFGEAYIAEAQKNPEWINKLSKAQARLNKAQSLAAAVIPAYKQFPLLVPKGHGRGTNG